jgi:hypothetical protein
MSNGLLTVLVTEPDTYPQFSKRFNPLIKQHNTSQGLCGYTSMVFAEEALKYPFALTTAQYHAMLTRVSDLDLMLPLVGNYMALLHTQREPTDRKWVANDEVSNWMRHKSNQKIVLMMGQADDDIQPVLSMVVSSTADNRPNLELGAAGWMARGQSLDTVYICNPGNHFFVLAPKKVAGRHVLCVLNTGGRFINTGHCYDVFVKTVANMLYFQTPAPPQTTASRKRKNAPTKSSRFPAKAATSVVIDFT